MGENKYVHDDWGKRGTYSTKYNNPPEDRIKPKYAAGGTYDAIGPKSPRAREVKFKKKRHWGIRIVLFVVLMVFLWKYPNLFSIKNQGKVNHGETVTNGIQTPETLEKQPGVNFDYHLENMIFYGEASDSAEVAIRDFLNIYQISYSDFYYDVEVGGYAVTLDKSEYFSSEEEVVAKSQEYQDAFQSYCSAKYSNFGINQVQVKYGYKQWRGN